MPKSILIDATHFRLPQPTGVEHYVDQLLPRVVMLLGEAGLAVTCVGHTSQVLEGATWYTSPYVRGWFHRKLPRLVREFDMFWTPSGTGLTHPAAAQVVTVHDLGAYAMPKAYALTERVRTHLFARRAAQVSAAILVPSQHTKDDLIARWQIASSSIHVTRLAPVLCAHSVPPRIELPDQFLLSVGRIHPTKGVSTLVDVLRLLPETRLVVAGRGDTSLFPDSVRSRVTLLGYVSEEEKRWLYEHARCFLMPSATEGFGMPVAEALSLGCQVVAADAGPLPEFGSVGVRYAKPGDAAAWATQVVAALEDTTQREAITSAHQFDWGQTARQTAEALLSVSKGLLPS